MGGVRRRLGRLHPARRIRDRKHALDAEGLLTRAAIAAEQGDHLLAARLAAAVDALHAAAGELPQPAEELINERFDLRANAADDPAVLAAARLGANASIEQALAWALGEED